MYGKLCYLLLALISSTQVFTLTIPTSDDLFQLNVTSIGNMPVVTNFSNTTNGLNSSLTAAKDDTKCIKKGDIGRDKYRPAFTDCGLALRQMPSSSDVKPFCSSPDAACRLPASASEGNCRITVSLVAGVRQDMTSWAEIGLGTLEMLDGCLDSSKSAGQTVVGLNNNIQITVSKIRD